jgi:SAM-dependent methyltransferase
MDVMVDKGSPDANFEFEALAWAQNYRRALLREFSPYLAGDVIEVGAGIGQFTEQLAQLTQVQNLLAVEPSANFCAQLRTRLPRQKLLEGTVSDLDCGTACDGVVSVNVLEHIEDDARELASYAALLKKRRGVLCLFVPARQEIYAPIDKDFGHFRRYSKTELAKKLEAAGFAPRRLHYFNFIGYFAWWFNFCLLGQRVFSVTSVRLFDRLIFPIVHMVESRLLRPPFGQSLLAVGEATR